MYYRIQIPHISLRTNVFFTQNYSLEDCKCNRHLKALMLMLDCFFSSVDRCKIMDSKKRPLWLEWTNADPKGPNILIMYKNGDGRS